jgi:hypothetical protein
MGSDAWNARRAGTTQRMSLLWIILIVIVLLALGVLGVVIEGLLWLLGIALLIFVVGAVVGYFRFRSSPGR